MANINWQEMGYKDGLAACEHSKTPPTYPVQDRYSPDDERDYISGYRLAQEEYAANGSQCLALYVEEENAHL